MYSVSLMGKVRHKRRNLDTLGVGTPGRLAQKKQRSRTLLFSFPPGALVARGGVAGAGCWAVPPSSRWEALEGMRWEMSVRVFSTEMGVMVLTKSRMTIYCIA